jgi:hypothetical protein
MDWANDPELKLDAIDCMMGWTIELTKLQIQFSPAPIRIARATSFVQTPLQIQTYKPKLKRFMIAGMRVVKHVINPIRPQLAITHVPTITNPVVPIKPVARVAPVARVEPVAGPDAFDRQLNRIEGSG